MWPVVVIQRLWPDVFHFAVYDDCYDWLTHWVKRKGFWDRHGANIVSPLKAVSLDIEQRIFAMILWEAGVTNVGALKL